MFVRRRPRTVTFPACHALVTKPHSVAASRLLPSTRFCIFAQYPSCSVASAKRRNLGCSYDYHGVKRGIQRSSGGYCVSYLKDLISGVFIMQLFRWSCSGRSLVRKSGSTPAGVAHVCAAPYFIILRTISHHLPTAGTDGHAFDMLRSGSMHRASLPCSLRRGDVPGKITRARRGAGVYTSCTSSKYFDMGSTPAGT